MFCISSKIKVIIKSSIFLSGRSYRPFKIRFSLPHLLRGSNLLLLFNIIILQSFFFSTERIVRSLYYFCKGISYKEPVFFKSCFLRYFPNVEQYFSDNDLLKFLSSAINLLTLLSQLTSYTSIRVIGG